ncbi:MAG TPA: flavodoxin family protein [candidate division Zixibacteria bacterium]|nr:flavodoxin family protein [candidate division Zixibacteria bacterium]
MKVTGIVGSPRIGGNTSRLVEKVLQGAASNGSETELLILNSMQISPCQACNHCKPSGQCILSDDMQIVYSAMESSSAIVVGTPIYMGQMSAQTKIFMDRLYAYYVSSKASGKPVVLAFTQGAESLDVYSDYIEYTGKIFTYLGYDLREIISATNTGAPGDILRQPDVLQRAFDCGASLVSEF